jgi:hypothetical protein
MIKESLNLGYNEVMELKIKILNIKKGLSKMKNRGKVRLSSLILYKKRTISSMTELYEMANFLWRQ